MLVAILVLILGFSVGFAIVQWWELRMAGVLIVPLVAVYTLYNHATLPIFVISTIVAYVALQLIQEQTVLYGRALFLAGIAVGALVPLLTLVLSFYWYGATVMTEVEFVASILPGIAAYNLHQLSLERRLDDVIISLGALTGLVLFGTMLIHPESPAAIDASLPPILFSEQSDVAVTHGVALDRPAYRGVISPVLGKVLVLSGLLLSEFMRSRWGIRPGGVIAVPLLAVFAMQDAMVVPMYLATAAIAYVAIDRVERQTLLYGRIILSISLIVSVALAIPLATALGVEFGLIALFTAIFGGISAYNYLVVPSPDRTDSVVLTAGSFLLFLTILQLLVVPAPGGVDLGPVTTTVTGAILVSAAWICYRLEAKRPTVRTEELTI